MRKTNAFKRVAVAVLATAIAAGTVNLTSLVTAADVGSRQQSAVSLSDQQHELRLWYDEPADHWMKRALPIGNGYMGGMVYGGIQKETFQFNEKTLWSGGPGSPGYNFGMVDEQRADDALEATRKKVFENGLVSQGDSVLEPLGANSAGFGAYQNLGYLYLDFGSGAFPNTTGYERFLDLPTATAGVRFSSEGVEYTREYFANYPYNVMAMRLSASEKGKLSFAVSAQSGQSNPTITAQGDVLTIRGVVPDNQMQHETQIKVLPQGGSLQASSDKIQVSGADSVVLLMTAGTNYANVYPTYRGEDPHDGVTSRLETAAKLGYDQLRQSHLEDYQEFFSRVELNLNQIDETEPTDVLLQNYNTGEYDNKQLEALLFQYGRYLLISSSREGTLPANLQGVWNNSNSPEWTSDYHMNINLQMNYWPAFNTNLAETALPLIDYVDSLREPGRASARNLTGVGRGQEGETGWWVNTMNNPFGYASTMGMNINARSPASNAWISQNLFDYYEFTNDAEQLEEIYPIIREAACFWSQMLCEDPDTGRLVNVPSFSSEHGPIVAGTTYDQSLIWQLYADVIQAAEALGREQSDPLIEVIREQKERLDPIAVGSRGQIKEWMEEDDPGFPPQEENHRHLSHLVGLYPGNLITDETTDWFEAAKVSLNGRGYDGTGWSLAHKLNLWARAKEGNAAYKMLNRQLKYTEATDTNYYSGGTYANLFCAHPPFQIDGNLGVTAGIAELLVQSHAGYIEPLPAVPSAWGAGAYKGLVARGNFEVGAEWENSQAKKFTITSKLGNPCTLRYDNLKDATVTDQAGNSVQFVILDDDTVEFETTAGSTYTVTGFENTSTDSPVFTGMLETALEAAQPFRLQDQYASAALKQAMQRAEQVIAGADSTQEEVDAVTEELNRLVHAYAQQFEQFSNAYERAVQIGRHEVSVGWSLLQEAILQAQPYAGKKYSDSTAVKAAYEQLRTALDGLLFHQNLALNKPSAASAIYDSDYPASKATDGDNATRWATPDGTTSCWLEVDFGAKTQFNSISISQFLEPGQVTRINRFTIEYWDDATDSWQPAYAQEGTDSGYITAAFQAVASTKVRLNMEGNNITLWEFGVYYSQPVSLWTLDSVLSPDAEATVYARGTLEDGTELTPDRVQSIVYETDAPDAVSIQANGLQASVRLRRAVDQFSVWATLIVDGKTYVTEPVVFEVGYRNLALGSRVQAQTEYPGYEGAKAVDGNQATRWASLNGEVNNDVILTFDSEVTWTEIVVKQTYIDNEYYQGYGIDNLDVLCPTSDGGWKQLATVDCAQINRGDGVIRVQMPAVSASQLKLVCRRDTSLWYTGFNVSEIEVYDKTILPEQEADKTILKKVLDKAAALKETVEFSSAISSVQASFTAQLEAAARVYQDGSASQGEVDAAWVRLMTEIHKLGLQQGQKSLLREHYELYSGFDLTLYLDGAAKENFKGALAAAGEMLENDDAVQSEVDAVDDALIAAAQALVERGDKTALQSIVDSTAGYAADHYAQGWAVFEDASRVAREVLDHPNATQEQVNAAVDQLIEAMLNLRLKADKRLLNAVIATAESIDLSGFSGASVERFDAALNGAKAAAADETLTAKDDQARVNQAEQRLREAIRGLENADGTSANLSVDRDGNLIRTAGSARTGDDAPFAALALLAGAAFVLRKRTKHR